ncbi:hypothetical protein [Humibacter sp. RRB41]|uniref:hypothetical protein n=1 Tax=Humibacter sp. RRB41 TaxID=2919946 RepID=UPI001FAA5A9C|nr:hypothetical protein [Humibacter sp. RRB41]
MSNSEQQHPNAEDIPDGSSSDTGHEDTASGGVSQDDGDSDSDDDSNGIDREHDTDSNGIPLENPSG